MEKISELAILLIGYILISGLMIFGTIRMVRMWHASKYWPTTPGKIIRSEMRRKHGYDARIFYEYYVNGKRYIRTTVILGGRAGGAFTVNKARAEKYLSKYPSGAAVNVLYNPNRPAFGYLERNENLTYLFTRLIFPIFLIALSLFAAYYLIF